MQNELTTPKAIVLSIFNDEKRDCYYDDIIFKVKPSFPNMTGDEIAECENYAEELFLEASKKFVAENAEFFTHTSLKDFEDACQDLTYDLFTNEFQRTEMYEVAVDTNIFRDKFFTQGGKYSDFGGESFDDIDHDFDQDFGYSYRQQCDADRSDYADTFSCPIQRAEIRMGA